MTTYQKIPGPFVRDRATKKLTAEFSSEDLRDLADVPIWNFTEKVDGTNVRILWDGYRVAIAGRSDNSSFDLALVNYLQTTFMGPENETFFEQKFGTNPAVLYGEGYGPKIQSGGIYRKDISFVLFDVQVGDWLLKREAVEDVASFFQLDVVPLVASGITLNEAIEMVKDGLTSRWGDFEPEGIVGTTASGLRSRNGERIIVKVKARDFRG